jgi:hypothetical protein
VYCGLQATTDDHIVPVVSREVNHPLWGKVVRACRECNSMASVTVFDDFEQKREFIQDKIRRRYSKLLKLPDWTEEELDTLGSQMRKKIVEDLVQKKLLLMRLAWPGSVDHATGTKQR